MTLHRLKPRLRVVEPDHEYGDYRDHLYRKERKDRDWQPVQPTRKQPGDLIVTSTKVEVQP